MDANGDGIGDFQGLMRRLDYLQGLGVTATWLMPFQSSPGRDDGYDISDYYSINPAYGTLGVRDTDLGRLVQQSPAAAAYRQHPAGRSRGTLLRHDK
jgi:glycosidase